MKNTFTENLPVYNGRCTKRIHEYTTQCAGRHTAYKRYKTSSKQVGVLRPVLSWDTTTDTVISWDTTSRTFDNFI